MCESKVENMSNSHYFKREITKDWLTNNGFKYSRMLSNADDTVYTYRFPIHKNGYFTTLECELSCIESTGEVSVDVYDYGTRNRYAAFYYTQYGDYSKMLKAINKRINAELKKLGIEKNNIIC